MQKLVGLVLALLMFGSPAWAQKARKFAAYERPYPLRMVDWAVLNINLELLREPEGRELRVTPIQVAYSDKRGVFHAQARVDRDLSNLPLDRVRDELTSIAIKARVEVEFWFPELADSDFEVTFFRLTWDKNAKVSRITVAEMKNGSLSIK